MTNWKEIRLRFLSLTFFAAVLIVGKILFIPTPYKPKSTTFNFPHNVPLPQWQFSASQSIPKLNYPIPELVSQWRYQYIQKSFPLDIEMHYFNGIANSAERMLYANKIFSLPKLHQQEGIGYYGLGVKEKEQRAYLVTCINPRGRTTVNAMQSLKNSYLNDVRPDRLRLAILGKVPLLDKRCLFTNMSIPLNNTSEEVAFEMLEKAFFDWYKWWYSNFPQL